jgi:hypothetical protein
MKGKVKSVPVRSMNDVFRGMQVYWTGCPSKVKVWSVIKKSDNDYVELTPATQRLNPIRSQLAKLSEIKTIVVSVTDGIGNDKPYHHYTLKYPQWKQSIDNGELDSDKTVEFEVAVWNRVNDGIIQAEEMAKVIPQKNMTFSKNQIIDYLSKRFTKETPISYVISELEKNDINKWFESKV